MSCSKPAPLTETFGNTTLPLGGKHGYMGVRGGQGSKRNKYQGCTPRKTHCTKLYDTAHEAAVNFALLKRRLAEESEDEEIEEITKKPRKQRSDKVRAIAPQPMPACAVLTLLPCVAAGEAAQPDQARHRGRPADAAQELAAQAVPAAAAGVVRAVLGAGPEPAHRVVRHAARAHAHARERIRAISCRILKY